MKDQSTHSTFSVRVPADLLKWIDRYTSIKSLDREIRVTRNEIINGFLEQMREIIELQEKEQWGGKSHIEVIREAMDAASAKHSKPSSAEKSA